MYWQSLCLDITKTQQKERNYNTILIGPGNTVYTCCRVPITRIYTQSSVFILPMLLIHSWNGKIFINTAKLMHYIKQRKAQV